MTVYLDDWRQPARLGWVDDRWSHLVGDTDEEVHELAARLGMRRSWFQVNRAGTPPQPLRPPRARPPGGHRARGRARDLAADGPDPPRPARPARIAVDPLTVPTPGPGRLDPRTPVLVGVGECVVLRRAGGTDDRGARRRRRRRRFEGTAGGHRPHCRAPGQLVVWRPRSPGGRRGGGARGPDRVRGAGGPPAAVVQRRHRRRHLRPVRRGRRRGRRGQAVGPDRRDRDRDGRSGPGRRPR